MAETLHQFDLANIFPVYTDEDGIEFYNLFHSINIEGDIDPTLYTTHIWTGTDNFYHLSYKYYNTTRLWWTILTANNIVNPFADIPAGTPLKILKQPVISQILSQMSYA
jgi:hypothetical protein